MGTYALAFLARGLKTNRRADWVAGGIFFALTQYFFEAGRLFFPPLIVAWLGIMAITNFKKLKEFGQGIGLFFATGAIVALPVYYTAIAQNSLLTSRMSASGTNIEFWQSVFATHDTNIIVGRLIAPFMAYIHLPETVLYYAGHHPMILEYFVPFFLLGLFYLFWMWRKATVLAPLWVLAASTANLLMLDGVQNPRFIIAYPAIAMTMAASICYVLPLLFSTLKRRAVYLATAALIVGGMCAYQIYYYF